MEDKKIDDGGPVYPVVFPERDDALLSSPGMTLRQHYAGLAMQALIANPAMIEKLNQLAPRLPDSIAEMALEQADALIAAGKE